LELLRQHACGWESYFDQRSVADFAGYAETGVIGFNQSFGYRQAKAGTNVVLIEPDLAQAFPDGESVNRALRVLLSAATAGTHHRRPARDRRLKRPGRKHRCLIGGRPTTN